MVITLHSRLLSCKIIKSAHTDYSVIADAQVVFVSLKDLVQLLDFKFTITVSISKIASLAWAGWIIFELYIATAFILAAAGHGAILFLRIFSQNRCLISFVGDT